MQKVLIRLTLAALAVFISGTTFAFNSSYGKVYRIYELDQAIAQATKEQKLIIVHSTLSKMCTPCRYVDGALDTHDVRNAYVGKYVFVQAWAGSGEDTKFLDQYDVRGGPHFIVLSPRGEGRCLSVGAFGNTIEAVTLGNNLAKVSAWPEWPMPRTRSTSPSCQNIAMQISRQ